MVANEAGAAARARNDFSVDIVIVNWNAGPYLRACVAALDRSSAAETLRVVVVDNASTDGSADALAAKRIALKGIHNAQNRGFAAACNQGAATGTAPFLLFLNPDANVEEDTLARTLTFLRAPENGKVAIVGVQLLDPDGRVHRTCARRPTATALLLRALFLDRLLPRLVKPHFMTEWDHRDTREVDQVPGAFLMIRRDIFAKLGGFDERFFVYYEDLDLCLRAKNAGWQVVHFAGARAEHIGGGTTEGISYRRLFLAARSQITFAAKHHGTFAACILAMPMFLVDIPARLFYTTCQYLRSRGWDRDGR